MAHQWPPSAHVCAHGALSQAGSGAGDGKIGSIMDRMQDDLLTQREAASLLRVGVSYLRASDCPKVLLPGNGAKARPLVRYRRSEVMAWAERWTVRASALQRRSA
jgi:hypothetical protein